MSTRAWAADNHTDVITAVSAMMTAAGMTSVAPRTDCEDYLWNDLESWMGPGYNITKDIVNITGKIVSPVNPDTCVIVCGHYDTITIEGGIDELGTYTAPNLPAPGADDNGSALAAMYEIAKVITDAGLEPLYTILFVAFDLEEYGCLGSPFFVANILAEGVTVKEVINIDMISYSAVIPALRSIKVNYYSNAVTERDTAIALINSYGVIPASVGVENSSASDSTAFYSAGVGKCIYLEEDRFSGVNPYYHSPRDTIAYGSCIPELMSQGVQAALLCALEFAGVYAPGSIRAEMSGKGSLILTVTLPAPLSQFNVEIVSQTSDPVTLTYTALAPSAEHTLVIPNLFPGEDCYVWVEYVWEETTFTHSAEITLPECDIVSISESQHPRLRNAVLQIQSPSLATDYCYLSPGPSAGDAAGIGAIVVDSVTNTGTVYPNMLAGCGYLPLSNLNQFYPFLTSTWQPFGCRISFVGHGGDESKYCKICYGET